MKIGYKLLSMALCASLLATAATPLATAAAAFPAISSDTPTSIAKRTDIASTSSDSMLDSEGNILSFEIVHYEDGDVSTYYYCNDELRQIALMDKDTGTIEVNYYNQSDISTFSSNSTSVEIYQVSDFIEEVPADEHTTVSDVIAPLTTNSVVDPEWAYYGRIAPTPILTGAKATDLYFALGDQEPDLHRFTVRQINISPKTAVSVVMNLFSIFVTKSLSISQILIECGFDIVGDIVTNGLYSEVCYSTQRVYYYPIIANKLIFTDAYIDRLWFIVDNNCNGYPTHEMANPSYRSNRGASPEEIGVNAQFAYSTM